MGSNGSKPSNELVTIQNNDVEISPTDPRSPTPEITRTPLQGKPGVKHNITKNCDLRKTFDTAANEENLIHNNPILSAVIKNHLKSYDPRSPTQDFERTPIVISSKIDELKNGRQLIRHCSDSCESPQLNCSDGDDNWGSCSEAQELSPEIIVPKNLYTQFCDISLNGTIEPEEPLGSSTASNEVINNNISPELEDKKPTMLLETNFDYVETEDNLGDSCEDVESPCESVPAADIMKNIPDFKILDSDPRSPSIGIERTPIIAAKVDESKEDNVEEMSDDSLLKVLQSTNAEIWEAIKHNKPDEGLLVYEDETTNINNTPRKSKHNLNSGSRTPLSCMKNKDAADTRSKSANMLNDQKNQKNLASKIPKRVSHIPRLKTLYKTTKLVSTGSSISLKNISKTTAIGGDCENTPPHSHRDKWDKDSSIVL